MAQMSESSSLGIRAFRREGFDQVANSACEGAEPEHRRRTAASALVAPGGVTDAKLRRELLRGEQNETCTASIGRKPRRCLDAFRRCSLLRMLQVLGAELVRRNRSELGGAV